MGFLIAWIAVVGGVGALLAGWMFGSHPAGAGLELVVSPERAALALVVVVVLLDLLHTAWRRRRR